MLLEKFLFLGQYNAQTILKERMVTVSIASMTGFARVNGQIALGDENISWVWEAKSVNGKGLELKSRLPAGYDDLSILLKNEASEYLNRGNINVSLEIETAQNRKKATIDDVFLEELVQKSLQLTAEYDGRIALPNVAELLNIKGVIEIQDYVLSEDEQNGLKQKILADFIKLCQNLKAERMIEGQKIATVLRELLNKIEIIVKQIDSKAETLPEQCKQKLLEQLKQYAEESAVGEDRIAQEVVLLATRADIREEIDRLQAHVQAARELLDRDEAVGRRLDFLCQELNREANTTCSKSVDIEITNRGMELKVLIEQFREQVQNIE